MPRKSDNPLRGTYVRLDERHRAWLAEQAAGPARSQGGVLRALLDRAMAGEQGGGERSRAVASSWSASMRCPPCPSCGVALRIELGPERDLALVREEVRDEPRSCDEGEGEGETKARPACALCDDTGMTYVLGDGPGGWVYVPCPEGCHAAD